LLRGRSGIPGRHVGKVAGEEHRAGEERREIGKKYFEDSFIGPAFELRPDGFIGCFFYKRCKLYVQSFCENGMYDCHGQGVSGFD